MSAMNLQPATRNFLFGESDELLLKSTEEYKTILYHNHARITIQHKKLKARAAQHYSETIRRKTETPEMDSTTYYDGLILQQGLSY